MEAVTVTRGNSCLVLGVPHSGTWMPEEAFQALNDTGRTLADTDWHIDKLYADLIPDATIVRANFHRYLIDANRDPGGQSLYPGQNTTGLCPLTDFDGQPIYSEGCEPTATQIATRLKDYHSVYHDALSAELARVRDLHGIAVLYDCHSIRSHIPFLFDGTLPDFNIGTNMGATCAHEMESAVTAICAAATGYSSILNGRFKGGWTTRHYGRPASNLHAIQMELAQSSHLQSESAPFAYDGAKAARLRPHLKWILESLIDLATSPKT